MNRSSKLLCPLALAAAMTGASTLAQAAGPTLAASDLGLSTAQLQNLLGLGAPGGHPGIAFGSPIGYGANWGTLGAAIGGQTVPDNSQDDVDGSMGLVAGFGDATNAIGLEVIVNIISLQDNFGEDGAFSAKLHRMLGDSTSIAIGVEGAGGWGAADNVDETYYAVGTHVMPVAETDMSLAINLGVGDGRFDDRGEDRASAIAGLALIVHPQVSTIVDWSGSTLNAGVSTVPLRGLPLTLSLGAINLTERNNGDIEFAGSVGYSLFF